MPKNQSSLHSVLPSGKRPMKISIAMATYNGARYLREQLGSFAAQTRLPHELIVSDDSSTDDTLRIVQEFAATAPFEVRFFRNDTKLGYAQNFGRALERCTGDLILLSDQDDVWFENKIVAMESYALENRDVQLIMCDAALTDAELNDTGLTKLGQIRSAGLDDESFVMGCCCAVRRDLLEMCMPIPVGFCAHDDWIVSFAIGLNRRHIIERSLQYYRRHGSNSSEFIANRTRKVSGLSLRFYQARQVLFWRNPPSIEHAIAQKELLIEGIENALVSGGRRWREELGAMLTREKSKLSYLRRRKEIRGKKPIARFCAILRSLFFGEYTGIKSAIRDFFG